MKASHSTIGHQFNNPTLETLAYTHPSCDAARGNNQRLEFLGDTVLDLVIAEALYHRLPSEDEGALDWAKASLVNGRSLAAKARELGMAERLIMSESQRAHHPEPSKRMLEDCLEAMVGAIYLDGGLDAARTFILQIFQSELEAIQPGASTRNAKSLLQEWSQQRHAGGLPEYELIASDGPDHQKRFRARALLNGQEMGQGSGSSIKAAEIAAATAALERLKDDA